MDRNVCGTDRRARLAIGAALLAVALIPGSENESAVSLRQVLAAYGAAEFLLINGTLQWCPLNALLGIDTCARDWPERLRGSSDGDSAGASERVREAVGTE